MGSGIGPSHFKSQITKKIIEIILGGQLGGQLGGHLSVKMGEFPTV